MSTTARRDEGNMNRVSVSITNFGIKCDDRFVASSISKALQEQIDEAKAALEVSTPGNHRVVSAKLRGVQVKAVVVGGA